LDLLDELRMTDNTLVIFTSDNGPENSDLKPGQRYYFSAGDTGGLRGRKRSLYLGGVNVPFLIRWPGQVPAGRVDETSLLSGVDMLPTLCAAAGIPLPSGYQTDGVNVLSALRGQSFTRTQPLFWEWRSSVARDEFKWPSYAMREGNWGLVMNEQLRRIELYDLHQDRMQKTNVAAQQPERVASMVTAIQNWKRTLPEAPNPECVARPATPVSTGKPIRKIQPQTVP
jgi:N-acetylgalactosamine-6-sulfatase